jgi:hypothetical protein
MPAPECRRGTPKRYEFTHLRRTDPESRVDLDAPWGAQAEDGCCYSPQIPIFAPVNAVGEHDAVDRHH